MSSVCCAAVVTCEPPSQSPRGFFFTTSLSVNLFLDDWSVLSLSSIPSSPACLSVCLSQLIRHASSAPIKPGPHLEHKANVLCSCSECERVYVCARQWGRHTESRFQLEMSPFCQCAVLVPSDDNEDGVKVREHGQESQEGPKFVFQCAPNVKFFIKCKSNLTVRDTH